MAYLCLFKILSVPKSKYVTSVRRLDWSQCIMVKLHIVTACDLALTNQGHALWQSHVSASPPHPTSVGVTYIFCPDRISPKNWNPFCSSDGLLWISLCGPPYLRSQIHIYPCRLPHNAHMQISVLKN